MSLIGIGVGISAAATVYGAVQANAAAGNAAQADENAAAAQNAVAAYNNSADLEQAAQIDLDTTENIRTERENNETYLSRQTASYAASGVLASSGSPLAARITTAGRLEQKVQQDWVNAQAQEQQLASQGAEGIYYGNAAASADQSQAQGDRISGSIALIKGGGTVAGDLNDAYQSGLFSQIDAGAQGGNGLF